MKKIDVWEDGVKEIDKQLGPVLLLIIVINAFCLGSTAIIAHNNGGEWGINGTIAWGSMMISIDAIITTTIILRLIKAYDKKLVILKDIRINEKCKRYCFDFYGKKIILGAPKNWNPQIGKKYILYENSETQIIEKASFNPVEELSVNVYEDTLVPIAKQYLMAITGIFLTIMLVLAFFASFWYPGPGIIFIPFYWYWVNKVTGNSINKLISQIKYWLGIKKK